MKARWVDETNRNPLANSISSAVSCPLNKMALCLEISVYFYLTQLCTRGILEKSWKTDHLKGVTQPPLSSHSARYTMWQFHTSQRQNKVKSYLHFSFWRLRITTLKMKTCIGEWVLWRSQQIWVQRTESSRRAVQDSSQGVCSCIDLLACGMLTISATHSLVFFSYLLFHQPQVPTTKQALFIVEPSFNQCPLFKMS